MDMYEKFKPLLDKIEAEAVGQLKITHKTILLVDANDLQAFICERYGWPNTGLNDVVGILLSTNEPNRHIFNTTNVYHIPVERRRAIEAIKHKQGFNSISALSLIMDDMTTKGWIPAGEYHITF